MITWFLTSGEMAFNDEKLRIYLGLVFASLVCDVFLAFYRFSIWCPGSGRVLVVNM